MFENIDNDLKNLLNLDFDIILKRYDIIIFSVESKEKLSSDEFLLLNLLKTQRKNLFILKNKIKN